jgi:superfamily II DNA or RNA helicase
MDILHKLSESIHTGFVDRAFSSDERYHPEFLTNDKEGGKKILTSILDELEICEEFRISVAFVTTGGVATLINTLADLEERKIEGKVLVSQYLNFTQPEALRRLLQFSNIDLRISTVGGFHSKGFLFKHGEISNLIIGSSNLTQTALCTNKEWNLKISAAAESGIFKSAKEEFDKEFQAATVVTESYISDYADIYSSQTNHTNQELAGARAMERETVLPNKMQREALSNIEKLRIEGFEKALLISATGTGKTYLSAFDVQSFKPKKMLFVVHRRTITLEALKTFRDLFSDEIRMGVYSGAQQEIDADYLFSTVQTIAKPDHLKKFSPDYFDYIVIDETHRAGAESYKRIMDYFTPKFLLGMTATPERTDGFDVFSLFDHNIAYEIRLHRALEENMLSPFHYYGVTDLTVNQQKVDDKADFNLLTSVERIDRIIEKSNFYGCDNGRVRGLIFCSRVDECNTLMLAFNNRGYKTLALTGETSEEDRTNAIRRIESDNDLDKLDYIFTVDIFNEGVDIPKLNQIIMLRPTQSAIVFVQQLGRGLRKAEKKEYLTVIDFIGNYSNNYLVPIALYGDISHNKDSLRKLISSGSRLLPGTSTINFDKIAKEEIFKAIDAANMQLRKDLEKDYQLLKFKLGRVPMMVDFLDHGARDPILYSDYSKSYFNFVAIQEDGIAEKMNGPQRKLLELFSNEINNAKRIEESLMLKGLIKHGQVDVEEFCENIFTRYGHTVSRETIISCLRNLNFKFTTENKGGKKIPVGEIYGLNVATLSDQIIMIDKDFKNHFENNYFHKFLMDSMEYSIRTYDENFRPENFISGFVLYQKYSRKDVFRILNWDQNPVAQNVGGYIVSQDKSNCPIFVNYDKADDISSSTKYEDGFVNSHEFRWMSKSNERLKAPM